jgi:hypothetical protein
VPHWKPCAKFQTLQSGNTTLIACMDANVSSYNDAYVCVCTTIE